MEIKIKYFDTDLPKLKYIDGKSDWIDLYARCDTFIPHCFSGMIPLNVAIKLPEGYEALVIPRSSTFKNHGIIQTNSIGLIDESYCGDNDEWKFPAYCLQGNTFDKDKMFGTLIKKGDRICQFRIIEHQPKIDFVTAEKLEGKNRGGFGSTGK